MKQARSQRRSKGEGAAKKLRRKRAAQALAAAGAIAGGTHAYAAPVRFDNPPHGQAGHFHWSPVGEVNNKWLGLTIPAGSQPAPSSDPTALRQVNNITRSDVRGDAVGGFQVQVDAAYSFFAEGVASGVTIPSGLPWGQAGYIYYTGYGSGLADGVSTYLGVRFGGQNCAPNCYYGWVGVVRTGTELEAFAWGYETLPGVAILAGASAAPATGACCDDATGTCTEDILQADCEGQGSRYGGDSSNCTTIDPVCEPPPPTGACCNPSNDLCLENVTDAVCPAEHNWTEGVTCADVGCNAIPTVSEWGLFVMSLGMLAAGSWVLKKRRPALQPSQA